MPDKKPVIWIDIENNLRNSMQNDPSPSPDETDEEKFAYFKEKILNHLDNLQKEEDKKIIPFPKKE